MPSPPTIIARTALRLVRGGLERTRLKSETVAPAPRTCPVCRKQVPENAARVEERGLVLHRRCATYRLRRRRAPRRGGPSRRPLYAP